MWTTFIVSLKANLRNRSALFWMVLFPIVLATMFHGMLGGLTDGYEVRAVPMAVVADANWKKSVGAAPLVNALSGEGTATGDTGKASDAADGIKLLTVSETDSVDAARNLLAAGSVDGYLAADANGRLTITLSRKAASSANSSTDTSGLAISLSALDTVIDTYNRTDAATRQTLKDNPQAVLSGTFWNTVGGTNLTRETTLTHFKPDATARYFYALLGMNCLMAMAYAVGTVTATQANLSALGIRRSIAPLSGPAQLVAGFLACWLCSSAAMIIALAYTRYVCGVGVGGREPLAVLAVVVASFMASSAGTMLGAIPKLSQSTKTALTSAISCTLSLFTGLYGGFAMELSDWIARNAPALGVVNPAQQVVNLFYSLMYYDGYGPFIRTCVTLLTMSAVFLAGGAAMMGRQRYEHL